MNICTPRREEPATVLARRYGISENTLYRRRDDFMAVGEAALANGKDKADPRAAVDPTDTALHLLAPVRQGFSPQMSIGLFMGRSLKQNRKIFFHLNCVPRQ